MRELPGRAITLQLLRLLCRACSITVGLGEVCCGNGHPVLLAYCFGSCTRFGTEIWHRLELMIRRRLFGQGLFEAASYFVDAPRRGMASVHPGYSLVM
jgi:hypothetical protein